MIPAGSRCAYCRREYPPSRTRILDRGQRLDEQLERIDPVQMDIDTE